MTNAKLVAAASRPKIEWHEEDYPSIMRTAERMLLDAGVGIYQSRGRLLHTYRYDCDDNPDGPEIVKRKAGALITRDVSAGRLNQYLTETIGFSRNVVDKKTGKIVKKRIAAPAMLSQHYLDADDQWRLPVLDGLVECPTLREDGSILTGGYDRASRLLLDTNGVLYPMIPLEPTLEQSIAALKVLVTVLDEFPFIDNAARSVALSAILTALVRHLMRGAPVHGFDAAGAGTGKSTLADVVSLIAKGCRAVAMSYIENDEQESAKAWLSILLAGDRIVSIDNVEPWQAVGGSTFNKITTQATFSTRQLSTNKNPVVSTDVLIMVNGNNLTFTADAVSRAIIARMNINMEYADRREYKRDIYSYVPEHRADLVVAALTILRGYWHAGRPFLAKESRFKDWDHTVRGALLWVGAADPMDTRAEMDLYDTVKTDRFGLVHSLSRCYGIGKRFTSPEVVERSCNNPNQDEQDLAAALAPHMGKGGHAGINTRSVTTYLTREKDMVAGGLVIRVQPGRPPMFWVEEVAAPSPEQGAFNLEPAAQSA
jgi:putative DNA primase/helicase